MRMNKISLNNFRSFLGEQEIDFPCTNDKNVTVVHGKNGAGKTALLNAFKWVLYGDVDFDTGKESLLNDIVSSELEEHQSAFCSVSLEFEDKDIFYYAKREQKYVKKSGEVSASGGELFKLSKLNDQGESWQIKSPGSEINSILPEDMHAYFFFNGERIEKLSYRSSAESIQSAIKGLMGLTIVERGIEHLAGGVKRSLMKEQANDSTGELKKIRFQKNEEDEKKQKMHDELKVIKDEKKSLAALKDEVDHKLKDIEHSSELQAQRERLERDIHDSKERVKNTKSQKIDLIVKSVFVVLGNGAFKETEKMLEKESKSGKLPAKVKATFIDDLLASGLCICDRSLEKGTPEYASVLSMKDDYSDEEMESSFFEIRADVKFVDNVKESFHSELSKLNNIESEELHKLADLSEELDELSQKISKINMEEIKKLEDDRKTAIYRTENLTKREAVIESQLSDTYKKIKDYEKSESELMMVAESNHATQKRIESVTRVTSTLESLLEHLTNEVRVSLSEKIRETFKNIIKKPYDAEISESFTLEVKKTLPNGQKITVSEKSTGENQVSSLSFISSIVAHAKERSKTSSSVFYSGGIFPLVMDSPFGALDPEYRRLVAKYIPRLADQVIIMVSDSQWRGEVQEQFSDRVNSSYKLEVKELVSTNGEAVSTYTQVNGGLE